MIKDYHNFCDILPLKKWKIKKFNEYLKFNENKTISNISSSDEYISHILKELNISFEVSNDVFITDLIEVEYNNGLSYDTTNGIYLKITSSHHNKDLSTYHISVNDEYGFNTIDLMGSVNDILNSKI